jgi:Sulfotransferase family
MTNSPFFIVGYERCGTTLLAAALDRHSRLAVPPETHFFTDVSPPHQAGQTAEPQFMVSHFFRGFRTRDMGIDQEQLLAHLQKVEPTWSNLFLESLSLYAKSKGKLRCGEKTPKHWRYLPEILNLFPESKAIWVVRDGRDAIASMMNMPWKPHNNLALHAMQWRFAMEKMLAAEPRFPGRILRVKFEDLVASPEVEVKRATEFIDESFESRQLDFTIQTGVVPGWEMEWKKGVFSAPDPTRIGAASQTLSPATLNLLNVLTEATLLRLGYAPTAAISASSAAG